MELNTQEKAIILELVSKTQVSPTQGNAVEILAVLQSIIKKLTEKVDEKGEVSEQTFNVLGTPQTTTLKDFTNEIDALKERISTAQTQLDYANEELTKKLELFDQMQTEVTTAFEALPAVAEPIIEPTPIEKLPPDILPVETPNEIIA